MVGVVSFEVLFYVKIGDLVNWFSKSQLEIFLVEYGLNLVLLFCILLVNILFVSLQLIIKY